MQRPGEEHLDPDETVPVDALANMAVDALNTALRALDDTAVVLDRSDDDRLREGAGTLRIAHAATRGVLGALVSAWAGADVPSGPN